MFGSLNGPRIIFMDMTRTAIAASCQFRRIAYFPTVCKRMNWIPGQIGVIG